jgi:glycosyltransferase involved in cell wall biosynthesis
MTIVAEPGGPPGAGESDAEPARATLVSIVVVVYNRLQFLDQAIRSALGQTHRDIQVVVVDDGSRIDPWPVVSPYGGRVEFVRKPNGGVASARNLGTAHARGANILFLDDDDYLEPTAVETLLAGIEGNPGTVWSAGHCAYVDEAGRELPGRKGLSYESGDIYERMIFDCLMSCPSSVMVRTEVIRALGGFDEEVCPSEDYDLWLALAREYPITAAPAIVTNYRCHTQQISKNQWSRHYQTSLRVLQKHRRRARIGLDAAFERSIARVNFQYGDSLYVSGDYSAAREQWRRSLVFGSGPSWPHVLGRFAKSYVPRPMLDVLRTLAPSSRAGRAAARDRRPGRSSRELGGCKT